MSSSLVVVGSHIDGQAAGADEAEWLETLHDAALPVWHPGPPGRIVVVSPHPDDETLAVGGLLHDLANLGWRGILVAVTDGERAYPDVPALGAIRQGELARALRHLGLTEAAAMIRLGIPDGAVSRHASALAAHLSPLIVRASWVLAPWPGDGHPDHEAAGRIAAQVAHELGVPARFFPVWLWHFMEPRSTAAAELLARAERWSLSAPALAAKREALGAFASQCDGLLGPPILPPHVLNRFRRSFEVVLR
jgi:LmbE family N-acetylglucosaminyl deacetylase